MAVTRVNSVSVTGSGTTTSVATIPGGTGIQAGDVLVVCANSNGTHVLNGMSVQDSVNAVVFTKVLETQLGSASTRYQSSHVYQTPQAIADGATITLTAYASAAASSISVDIFRGATATIDQAAVGSSNASGSTSAAPALGSNATAGSLVITLCSDGSGTLAAGSPFTTGSTINTTPSTGIGYVLSASGASTYASTWALGTANTSAAQTVSFLAAAAASPAPRAAPGRTWLKFFRHPQQPAQFASEVTEPPGSLADAGTGTVAVSGSKAATGSLSDAGTAALSPAGGGNDTPLLPPQALPGPSWLRRFRHRQQPAQFTSVLTLPPGSLADAATGTIGAAGSKAATGSLADAGTGTLSPSGGGNDTPQLPAQAQPGRSWARRFRHPQRLTLLSPPGPPSFTAAFADSGTGTILAAGTRAATGSLADAGTGTILAAGSKADSGTALISGTGTIAPSGAGGDTPVLPSRALPGRSWLRRFRHRQQPVLNPASFSAPLADAGTGAISAAGTKAATGSSAISGTGTAAVPGSKGSGAAALITGTGTLAPAGAGADTAVLPPAAPGRSWLRRFRHRQQVSAAAPPAPSFTSPFADAGTGTIGAAGSRAATGSSAISGTGTASVSGAKGAGTSALVTGSGTILPSGTGADTAVLPPAAPGRTWRRFFRHSQVAVLTAPPKAATGSSVLAATGTLTATFPPPPPVFLPGLVTIAPYGAQAARIAITPVFTGTIAIAPVIRAYVSAAGWENPAAVMTISPRAPAYVTASDPLPWHPAETISVPCAPVMLTMGGAPGPAELIVSPLAPVICYPPGPVTIDPPAPVTIPAGTA